MVQSYTDLDKNSEILIGRVDSQQSAEAWLRDSFLYVRISKNPCHYQSLGTILNQKPNEVVSNICHEALDKIVNLDLARGTSIVESTALGAAMARYCVMFDTMSIFLGMPRKATVSVIV